MTTQTMQAHLFGSVFLLSNHLQLVGDRLDEAITTKQWLLLAVLFKQPNATATLSELASHLGSSRQNVKKMASILEEKGFLCLNQSEKDRRVVEVHPTQACLDHLKGREHAEQQFLKAFYQGFSDEDLAFLVQLFHRWQKNLGKMELQYGKEE